MQPGTLRRLEKMTNDERERRFDELRDKFRASVPLGDGRLPGEGSLEEQEEYHWLAKNLGY